MNTEETQDMMDLMIHMLGYFSHANFINVVIDAVTHHNFDSETADRLLLMINHEDRDWFNFRMNRIIERGEAK